MHSTIRAWSIPIITYIAAAISFAFSAYDPLWELLGLPNDQRASMTTGFSLFLMLLGHFLGVESLDRTLGAKIDTLSVAVNNINHVIGQSNIHKLGTGDDGLRYLVSRFASATSIQNTRVPSANATKYRSEFAPTYGKAFEELVRSGTIVREIVGVGLKSYCEKLASISRNADNPTYHYSIVDPKPISFINFTIIGYHDGAKEVIFGWPVSAVEEFSAQCFASKDPSLIQLFDIAFRELAAAGSLQKKEAETESIVSAGEGHH